MPRDGKITKAAIMDAAECLILDKGYAGASIERIIDQVGITKGAFFYHFKSKHTLALALVNRYAAADLKHLNGNMSRAEDLSRDPLQQMVIFVGLFREEIAQLTEPFPGCLYASVLQEAGLFDAETIGIVQTGLLAWRNRLKAKFEEISAVYPPRRDVNFDDLADLLWVIFEGAFLLAKTENDARAIFSQLEQYRIYLELLFAPTEAVLPKNGS